MYSNREHSPPPAYSEQSYDKKLHPSTLYPPVISEEDEEWNEREAANSKPRKASPLPAQINQRAARKLPIPPIAAEADWNEKPLRIHKKSASHSYPPSEATYPAKSEPWRGGGQRGTLSNSSFSPSTPQQHHFPRSTVDHHSGLSSSASGRTSHKRSASTLHFDASVAYSSSEFSPVSASTIPPSTSFNPSSFYNSAVSSHLPSAPTRSHKPQTRSMSPQPSVPPYFSPASSEPPRTPPAVIPVLQPQRDAQSQSSYNNATQFPRNPSFNSHVPSTTSHERWATSQHQFMRA